MSLTALDKGDPSFPASPYSFPGLTQAGRENYDSMKGIRGSRPPLHIPLSFLNILLTLLSLTFNDPITKDLIEIEASSKITHIHQRIDFPNIINFR